MTQNSSSSKFWLGSDEGIKSGMDWLIDWLIDVGIVWRQTANVTDAEINLDEIYIDLK